MKRFARDEVEGIAKRNSSRLAKNSRLSISSVQIMNDKYLKHLESDNISSSRSKSNIDSLVYAQKEEVRLPKKKERKKGKLDGIRRLPLHISLQSAIQDAENALKKDKEEQGEESKESNKETIPDYININSEPPMRPTLKICGMCGYEGSYTCTICKSYYCSIVCRDTHTDTRCMKWKV